MAARKDDLGQILTALTVGGLLLYFAPQLIALAQQLVSGVAAAAGSGGGASNLLGGLATGSSSNATPGTTIVNEVSAGGSGIGGASVAGVGLLSKLGLAKTPTSSIAPISATDVPTEQSELINFNPNTEGAAPTIGAGDLPDLVDTPSLAGDIPSLVSDTAAASVDSFSWITSGVEDL
jgi:hypothetical protein